MNLLDLDVDLAVVHISFNATYSRHRGWRLVLDGFLELLFHDD